MPAPGLSGGGSSSGAPGLGGSSGSSDLGGWRSAPSPVAPETGGPITNTGTTVGTFGVDVTTPEGFAKSMQDNVSSAQEYTKGLSSALFGTHQAGTSGENQGGVPLVADAGRVVGRVPILGPLAGIVGEAGGAVLGAVGGAVGAVGGPVINEIANEAQRTPITTPEVAQKLHEQFAAIPDSEEKAAVKAAIAADPDRADHLMYEYARDYAVRHIDTNPQLYPELATQPATLADGIIQAVGATGLTSRAAQRLVGGSAIRADGLSRMDGIDQVARGISVFTQGDSKLTDAERIAWEKWSGGSWSIDEANDFLAASDQGISHDTRLQIVSGVALDPQVWGSVGAASFSKVGMLGLKLIANPEAATLGRATFGQVISQGAERLTGVASLSEKEGKALYDSAARMARGLKMPVPDLPEQGWEQLASQAGKGLTGEQAMGLVNQAAQNGAHLSHFNLLGQLAKTQKATDIMRVIGGRGVGSVLQAKYLGQSAKIVRSIIDPFHLLAGTGVVHDAATGLLSEAAPRIVDDAFGHYASAQVVHALHDIKPGLGLDDAAGYAANLAREVATEDHIAAQFAAAGIGDGGAKYIESLVSADVNAVADAAMANAPRNLWDKLRLRAISVRPTTWGETEMKDLAMRLHSSYTDTHGGNGPASVEEWAKWLEGRSTDQLSKLHAMTFQNLSSRLMDAVGQATVRIGEADSAAQRLSSLYLMRRGRLTTAGVSGILDRMGQNAANLAAQVEEMKTAQKTYAELRFIAFREVDPSGSVDDFIKWLTNEAEDGRFPTQLLDNEISGLADEVQAVEKLVSGTFSLAYRPAEEGLMGLSRGADGRLARAYAPWVDRVSNGTVKAHGTFASDHNIIGLPLLSTPIGKPIDVIDAGLRTARSMVSTEAITMRATQRFQTLAADKYNMNSDDAKAIIEAVQNAAGIRHLTVRGLRASDMQEAVRALLPRGSKMTPADILNLTLEAYEGDLRYVGLTQKFTGAAKTLFGKSGSNFAGQVSEDLYQKIRFQYNLVFQAQEKVEPWVLSAQRGVLPGFGTHMTEFDRQAARVAQNLRDTGMMRAAAIDAAEQSSYAVVGSDLAAVFGRDVEPGFLAQLRDVRGTKFVEMNKVAARSSAAHVRAALDQSMPGYFDRLVEYDSIRMGHPVSDEEALAHWLNEGGLTHGIDVPDVVEPGIGAKLFSDHIRVGELMRPVDIGELRGLDLDYWAGRIGVVDSHSNVLHTEAELRSALADRESGITPDTLRNTLLEHGAHATQADRVVTSLNFNYNTFINTLTRRYALTPDESRDIGNALARMASERDMSPADYISQIFSPAITGGEEAAVGQLGALVDVMRSGRIVQQPDLARLGARLNAAGDALATRDDMMRNLATVFGAHLDPSARWTLLQEFKPELRQAILDGTIGTDMQTLEDMWAQGADHWFAQGMMHNTTEASITDDAADYMARNPGNTRGYVARDPDGHTVGEKVTGSLGDGLLALPDHLRKPLVRDISEFTATVPDVPVRYEVSDLHALDPVIPLGEDGFVAADGVTYMLGRDAKGGYAVHLEESLFGQDSSIVWQHKADQFGRTKLSTQFHDDAGDIVPRQSFVGAPYDATPTQRGLIAHEHGHTIDLFTQRAEHGTRFDALKAELDLFEGSTAARQLSEIATRNGAEARADLIGMALDPNTDMAELERRSLLRDDPTRFDNLPPMSDTEYWRDIPAEFRPDYTPPAGSPESIADEVTKVREMMIDANLLRPIDPGSADMQRAAQMFGRWTTNVIRDGLSLGEQSQYATLLHDISLIPTGNAVPYNLTHGLMVQQVENAMVRGSEDAFRLNFFKQNRTFAERSLNHPFFGVYPASYMWGKIAPELARFMMTSPFGIRTGAASYVARDIAHQIAVRQETDPEFAKMMSGVNKSDIGWFLSYLLPALPWDVGAAAPAWTRDLAQQGLDNQARVDKGLPPKAISLASPLKKVADYVSPFRQFQQVERPLNELGQDIFGSPDKQKQAVRESYVAPTDDHSGAHLAEPLTGALQSLEELFTR